MNTAERKPVDVLATLNAAAENMEAPVRERRGHRDRLFEARDVLVELIAATKDNVASGCPCSGCERVRAALAAVGGSTPA